MSPDDIFNAKAEIFMKAFGFREMASAFSFGLERSFAPDVDTEALVAVQTGRQEGRRDARDLIALGAFMSGENNQPGAATLAILVQQRRLIQHPIVEKAMRIARGEAQVVYTGGIRRYGLASVARKRPLSIGCSVGHYRVTAGTLGCFVRKRDGGGIGLLSNNHVLADTNRARIGDTILQPGRADGGRRDDPSFHVAQLHHFIPIDFGPRAINRVDAAYAMMMHGVGTNATRVGDDRDSPDLGWTVGPADGLAVTGERVKKFGRTTQFSRGEVAAINIDNLQVAFHFGSAVGTARFDGQISITSQNQTFSKPGDSGSVIFTDENRPIALLFAGSDTGGHEGRGLTFATPIDTVLDALDIDIHTGS